MRSCACRRVCITSCARVGAAARPTPVKFSFARPSQISDPLYTYASIYSTLYFLHAYYIPTYDKRLLRVHISVYDLRTAKCPAKYGIILFFLNTIDFGRTNSLLIRPPEVVKVDSFCTNCRLSRRPLSFIANETGLEL